MSTTEDDRGTIVALLERFQKQRLPAALALKAKVDSGEKLDDGDVEFLSQVFDDIRDVTPILGRHPELAALAGKISSLYKDITTAALANETGS